jgi:glycine cleavage system aminomethyltransferase T
MAASRVKGEDFVGKEAHLRHREEEPAAIMCSLTVDDHTSKSGEKRYMLGREPILTRDGKRILDRHGRGSYVTSAGAGPSLGKHILMAYLPPEHAVAGAGLSVQYMGESYPVTVAVAGSTPVFDPENLRIRS